MMLGVNHHEADQVRERQAPENGVIEMRPPGCRCRSEIGFEITHGGLQASQEVARWGRRPRRLNEVRGSEGAFAKVSALEHLRKKEPASEYLLEARLSWPGEASEEHAAILLVGECNVFRDLTGGPFARGTGHRPLRGRDTACCSYEGADSLAIGDDRVLEISHLGVQAVFLRLRTREIPITRQTTPGQNVRNARKPGPIGFGLGSGQSPTAAATMMKSRGPTPRINRPSPT